MRLSSICIDFCCSTATDPRLGNKQRYPGAISVGPPEITTGIVMLMDKFGWTSLSVICDSRSIDPLNVPLLMLCQQGKMVFDTVKDRIQQLHLGVDSTKNCDFHGVLTEAKKFSCSKEVAFIKMRRN